MNPSVFIAPKRQNFLNDYTRNVSAKKQTNDFGKSGLRNVETERASTEDKKQTLNIQQVNRGIKNAVIEKPKITNKQTVLYKHSGFLSQFNNEGNYNSAITNYTPLTTIKEMYIDNKYKAIPHQNKGLGYTVAKYNADTTLKEITSKSLNGKYFRTGSGSRERIHAISDKSTVNITTKPNTLLGEEINSRIKYQDYEKGNFNRVAPSTVQIGKFQGRTSIENNRIDVKLGSQLVDNPFFIPYV